MQLYALLGRMRLVSDRLVVVAAMRAVDIIIETYLGPNRTLHEMMTHKDELDFLTEFGDAARKNLAAR